MSRHLLPILLAFLLLFPVTGAIATEMAPVTKQLYLQLQSQSVSARIETLKQISKSGLTDRKLFDLIERRLESEYLYPAGRYHIDEMAWSCKALASSGIIGYQATLHKVAKHARSAKLRWYANQSLRLYQEYAYRNKVLDAARSQPGELSPEARMLVSMLESEQLKLKRDAAKTITRGTLHDPAIYAAVEQQLLKHYRNNPFSDLQIDTMAWLCKALAASGDRGYRATLEQVATGSPNRKLQKYAAESLYMLK